MMQSQPLVSIITPTYNHKKYIEDCIQSAIDQTYTHWEMIVVNDGSMDNTSDIVKIYAEKDSRIRLFEQKNIGIFRLSESYNFALSKANGKYIAVLEGDDVWYPNKLSRQIEALESDPETVLAWGAAHQANSDLSQIILLSPHSSDPMVAHFFNKPLGSMLNVLFYRNCIPALTMIIRKQTLLDIGGFKQGYGLPLVDLPTLQMLATCGFFYFDPEPLGSWRVYPEQTTKTYLVEIFKGFYQLAQDNYVLFSKNSALTFSVNQSQLKSHFNNTLVAVYSRVGRYRLLRGQYKAARKDYLTSLFHAGKGPVWRLRSVVGLAFSLLHINVEGLARMLGRPSYKS
jgi:glycosyltransferase involved in cell wall biosynthesis